MTSSDSDFGRLTEKEKAVLFAAYSVLDSHINMHISEQTIRKYLKGKAQFKLKKPIRTLVSMGLLRQHPTKGGMTYHPTRQGIKIAKELFPKLFPEN